MGTAAPPTWPIRIGGSFARVPRRLAERDAHRRNAEQDRRLRRRHGRQCPFRLEARDDRDGGACEEGRNQPGGLSEHVRERRGSEHDVLRAEAQRLRRVAGCSADAPMGEDGTLRPPGRARGEEDHRRLVVLALDDPGVRSTAEGQLVVDEPVWHHGAHALLDLWRGEQDVQWHDDRAGSQGAEERGYVCRGVREPQRDAVASPDASGGERGSRLGDATVEFHVADRLSLEVQRRPVRGLRGGVRNDVRQVHGARRSHVWQPRERANSARWPSTPRDYQVA